MLAKPFAAGRYTVDVDPTIVKDNSGNPLDGGARVPLQLNVLPGDVNRDGRVNGMDLYEVRARLVATKAALDQLDVLALEDWTRDETVERMRALYEYRKRRFAARAGKLEDDGFEDRSLAYQQMVQIVLAAQRNALIQMRADGNLSNEVTNRIVRELDLEESRLEI